MVYWRGSGRVRFLRGPFDALLASSCRFTLTRMDSFGHGETDAIVDLPGKARKFSFIMEAKSVITVSVPRDRSCQARAGNGSTTGD